MNDPQNEPRTCLYCDQPREDTFEHQFRFKCGTTLRRSDHKTVKQTSECKLRLNYSKMLVDHCKMKEELAAARAELAKVHRRIHGDESEDCVFCASKKQTPGGDDPQCYLCAMEAELAALREEQAKPQWLPIESAPTNGINIMVFDDSGMNECDFNILYKTPAGNWYDQYGQIDLEFLQPTHWMPLPAAPPRDLREGGE